MTLILSCVTEEYVIQASDRRLTYPNGKVYEDKENKVVDWAGQVVFGYTGLARISGYPTDYWLSEALLVPFQRALSLNDILEAVKTKATQDFRKLSIKDKRWKRLTILGVGWLQLFDTNETRPAICTISNCLDNRGNPLAVANDEFKADIFIINKLPRGFYAVAIGQEVKPEKASFLEHSIGKCISHKGIGPEPIVRLLVETIRDVAKDNNTVGNDILVTCIPKESLNSSRIPMPDGSVGFLVSSSKPQKSARTFQYVPHGQEQGIAYGPNFVLGASWLRGFLQTRVESQDKNSVQAKTMRLEPGAKQGVILFDDGVGAQFISPPQ